VDKWIQQVPQGCRDEEGGGYPCRLHPRVHLRHGRSWKPRELTSVTLIEEIVAVFPDLFPR
jgi:hypothetical protein